MQVPNAAKVPDMPELEIVGHCPECAAATLGNVVLLLWRKRPIVAGAHWARRAFLHAKQHPAAGILFFTVIERDCNLSTPPEVREETAELLKTYADKLTAAAVTFENTGFKATMVRSIITAINMASSTRFPNSVFGDAQVAAAWLSSHSRGSTSATEIITAINTLRGL